MSKNKFCRSLLSDFVFGIYVVRLVLFLVRND